MVTKGYGFTAQDIDESCPADLEPYLEEYKLEEKRIDEYMWTMGRYVVSAVYTSVERVFAGRKAQSEYLKEPLTTTADKNRTDLTEDEIQMEVDKFFAESNAMRINWQRTHGKSNEE